MLSLLRSALIFGALIVGVLTLLGLMGRSNRRPRPQVAAKAKTSSRSAAQNVPAVATVAASNQESTVQTTPMAHGMTSSSRRYGVGPLKAAVAMGLIVALVGAGTALADQPVDSSPAGATVIPWVGEQANQASYWNTYFAGLGYDYTCVKINVAGDFTTNVEYAAIVVKGGQYNFIWQPAPAGTYSTSPEVSHYYLCSSNTVEDDVIDPKASIGGPCNDPAYYGVFDNTGSTVAIRFRYRWYTNYGLHAAHKTVPAGAIFRTWEKWAKPNTLVRIAYKDPSTNAWIQIASITAGKGNYPPCVYQRGFEFPNP